MKSLSFCPACPARLRTQLSFLLALSCLLPMAMHAQVSFTGAQSILNFGSQAVGSTSATVSLAFKIEAGTKVGRIAVLTTGISGKDFLQSTGSTCTATTAATTTDCVVKVSFKPLAPGLRRGAVAFYAGGSVSSAALAAVPVFGIGAGAQLVFGPGGAHSSVGSGFISPEGVTVDAAGNLYLTDIGLQEVFKVTPSGKQTTIGSGLQVPAGAAVDGAGNVYIADSQAAVVFKVTPGGVQTTVGSGFSFPSGIAIDGAGNVFVSDPFIPTVFKISAAGKQTMVGSGYNTPAGVAVDAAGNLYVADTFNAAVFKITPNGKQTTVGGDLNSPAAVAVDAAGNLYVTDTGTNALYEVTPSGTQSTVSTGLDAPNGVAMDGSGNLYVADSFSAKALKINRAEPPSLTFKPTKVNSTSNDSPKDVEVENIGNASLQFSDLSYPVDFPEGGFDNDCTTSTSLETAGTCELTIDFHPVTPLGTNSSAVLKEAVSLTTNSLNVTKNQEQVAVSGTETRP